MIDGRRDAEVLREVFLHRERVLYRGGVDDAGAFQRRVVGEQPVEDPEFVGLFVRLARLIDQVRPVEALDDRLDVLDA